MKLNKPMRRLLEKVVADSGATEALRAEAQRQLDAARASRRRVLGKSEPRRRVEEAADREREACRESVWRECIGRTLIDHGGYACELCLEDAARSCLEPHHLEGGSGRRVQEERPSNVMAVCRSCHDAYHLNVRAFMEKVSAWCRAHGYPLPNRKEYRDAR